LNPSGDDLNLECLEVLEWIDEFVIELGLCPFAGLARTTGGVRAIVTAAVDIPSLLSDLTFELELLVRDLDIETTLLIHPGVLTDFEDYNDFLDLADGLLQNLNLDGELQIASFHPSYCFADSKPNDPENLSNRSPYPLLHLLREDSVTRAIKSHADIEAIPKKNIALLRQLRFEGKL
jgi:hypothetical protein